MVDFCFICSALTGVFTDWTSAQVKGGWSSEGIMSSYEIACTNKNDKDASGTKLNRRLYAPTQP